MMRRFTAFLLICSILVSGIFFNDIPNVSANESTTQYAAESTTEVNLIDSDDTTTTDTSTQSNTSSKGVAYGIDEFKGAPEIVAGSAVLMDSKTGTILYGKEDTAKRYPASITKIMTALLTIEHCKMDDIVTFSNTAVNGIEEGSSSAGINVGAKITVRDTLYAMMLVSANEAAAALAEQVSGSVDQFAKLMTQRAKDLGCTGTNFTNPHGLPDENHYTTARDMALIMQECLKYKEFREIASATYYVIDASDTLTNTIELYNHAKILRSNSDYYYEYATGGKTGFTQAAWNTLVTYGNKDDNELICVILKDQGADNSYYDSAKLYKWGFEQVKQIKPLKDFDLTKALSSSKKINQSKIASYLALKPSFDKDFSVLVKKDFNASGFRSSLKLNVDLEKGTLGNIIIYSGDKKIGSTPVTFDPASDNAKELLNSEGSKEKMETAPLDSNKSIFKSFAMYMIRIAAAIVLIFVIMQLIRRQQMEKRRKKRVARRKKKHINKHNPQRNGSSKPKK